MDVIFWLGEWARVFEVVLRGEGLVGVKLGDAAMKFVCAGLGDDIDRRSSYRSLLRIVGVRDDVHALDAIRRGNVGDVGGQPGVGVRGAVNSSGVTLCGSAVDVGGHGYLRIAGRGVGLGRGSEAGNDFVEGLEASPLGRSVREIMDIRELELRMHISAVGV